VNVLKKALVSTAVFIVALALLARAGVLSSLFSSNYVAHRYCYLAQPGLVWTNVTMDGLIGASYALIFACLFWIANRLRGVPDLRGYLWIFISFGIFIVACGATHLMEIVTIWIPVYPLSATVKVICAAASVPTAILFAIAAPTLAANMRRFLEMLSTTRHEKEQAMLALVASEKLAVAGRISASITHEIKNPLDTANNVLYLVAQDERVPADLVALLATATSELERANSIAQSTLSLYRQSSEPVPLSLSEVVQSVLELQAGDLMVRSIALDRRLRTPMQVKAYSGELRQILINLIQNAAAAIGSDGRILVRVQPRHFIDGKAKPSRGHRSNYDPELASFGLPGYSITIADTGSGIDSTNRSRLFTLFFSTKGEQGTGLGLWLVRSMVEKQGGRIIFRSRTEQECASHGTIFNIWIPLEAAQVSAPDITNGVMSSARVVEMVTGGLSGL
jgi:signal transduction histidine kinase